MKERFDYHASLRLDMTFKMILYIFLLFLIKKLKAYERAF